MHNSPDMSIADQQNFDLGFTYSYFNLSEILDFTVLLLGCYERIKSLLFT